MKKRFLTFLSLLLATCLVGCTDLPSFVSSAGEDDSSENNSEVNLPNTIDESVNKLMNLGKTKGFEITFVADSDDEGENSGPESETVGLKNDIFWIKEESAYKKDGTNIEVYNYDAATQKYEYESSIAETEQLSLDYLIKNFTASFYIGYEIVSNPQVGTLVSEHATTFIGRPAKEYVYQYKGLEGQADINIVFDDETGITLKINAAASTVDGQSGFAVFEITSFKVGDAVTLPVLNKDNGGQGQQGGEGEAANFSNIKLAYVSNTNANIYVGSSLSLFRDGSFELSFLDNGSLTVMIGKYTVNSDSTMATLVVEKVYKEKGKEYIQMSQTWTLTYAGGLYALAVSSTGIVNFTDAHEQPVHADIPNEGGQGGQGEQGETSRFVNHKFDCFRHNGATLYNESSLTLFQDGTFEFVFKDSNKLVVFIGVYDVNEADTVATLTVQKVYKEQSNSYTKVNQTWTFTYNTADYYTLTMNASTAPDYEISNGQPMHADIPDDPNQGGTNPEDERFQVTSAIWNSMIVEKDVVRMDSNFAVRETASDNTVGYTLYEFDNGKVHYYYKDAYGSADQYSEFISNIKGYSYYQDNYAAWVKTEIYTGIGSYNNSIGILSIPFEKMTYSSANHAYILREWQDPNGATDYWYNISISFDNGKLQKISYEHWNIRYEFEFYGYGTTTVTMPQEGGGNHPTAEQLNDLVRNKVYVYDSALDNTGSYAYSSKFNEFFSGNQISFFTDNSFELTYQRVVNYPTGETANNVYVFIGTYQVQEDSYLRGYNSIYLTVNKVVIDGVLAQDNISEVINVRITPNENKVTVWEYDGDFATYYAKSESLTPTHITYTEPVTPPNPGAKWPAEDIASKLATLGINVTLPSPYNSDDKIVSVTNVIDGESLKIVITFSAAMDAITEMVSYISADNATFAIDYNLCDFDNMVYVYLNTTKDVMLSISYSESAMATTIIVSKKTADPYPNEAIVNYLRTNYGSANLPSLEVNNASYSFSDAGYLVITPLENNTVAAVIADVENALINANFPVVYLPGSTGELTTVYLEPSVAFEVMVMDSPMGDGTVWVVFMSGSEFADVYSATYPEAKIAELYIEGMTDTLPSLAVDGAVYLLGAADEGYELFINMQPNSSASKQARAIQERLLSAGFVLGEDGVYKSANGEITLSISSVDDKVIDVLFQFSYEEPEPQEPQEVTYNLICDNDWDITVDDAQVYAYVWDAEGNYEWILLEKNDEGTFTLETVDTWIGVKIVRFSDDSEIDWKYGGDGSVNEYVNIWNESGDIVLNGQSGDIHFSVH